jgi:hypothetical protein
MTQHGSRPCGVCAVCGCMFLGGAASASNPAVAALGSPDDGGEWGLTLTYTSTTFIPNVISTLNIICDPSATDGPANPAVTNDPSCPGSSWCNAVIDYRTAAICPSSGGGAGWVITFIILGALSGYTLLGGEQKRSPRPTDKHAPPN